MNTKILISSLSISLLLLGCGGSSDSSSDTTSSTTTTSTTSYEGQLVDSYLENVDYTCADGSSGQTGINGEFTCQQLPVEFKFGSLTLGSLSTLPSDSQVFPQDLVGVARTDYANATVLALARFLQSCDDDNNTNNGIKISNTIKNTFTAQLRFNPNDIASYASDLNITLIDETTTIEHLTQTTEFISSLDDLDKLPTAVKEALLSPQNTLNQETKNTLAYMGNEERLAYDVYNYLYNYHLNNSSTEIKQLTNIATKSEAVHIQTVQLLVKKYITDISEFTNVNLTNLNYLDTDVEDMPSGTYFVTEIQDLYNTLIAKGVQSQQDALEVGCMVEVTDINDLLSDIQVAKDSGAEDVVSAFEFLRDGSYSHYWAFDKGLKNLGITDGCCSLGSAYCHTEYPETTHGQ